MPNLPRSLFRIAAFAGLSLSIFAQTGPQLTVGPGLIYTVASRASTGINSAASFNAVAYWNPGSGPATVYVADGHQEGTLTLGYVYAVNLASGQVSVYAGANTGASGTNALYCTPGTPAICPGDNGPAVNALLHSPTGLAVDSAGNLFIADGPENVIRRVDAVTKVITTIAGVGGSPGPGNDNVPATQANLVLPTGLAFDAANNLYIADSLSNRVRRIAAGTQVITTVAGTTILAPGFGGDNGPATSAQLNQPTGVVVDSAGNILIADSRNHVVRRVSGGVITTVAGQGTIAGYTGDGGPATAATLNYPRDLAVDAGGNLYITDTQNNVVRKVTGDVSHTISTLAGNGTAGYTGDGGPAVSALLNNTSYVVADTQNNLFVVDNQSAVREITSGPARLTLPLTAVGSDGNSPFPLTISNAGNGTLTISSYTFPANFVAGSGGTCTAGAITLAPGASCTLPVTFIPTSGGSTSGNLVFTSNTGNGTNVTTNVALSETNGLYFVPIPPCRVIDTRASDPTYGGGAFSGGQTRSYAIRYSGALGCGSAPIPANADVQAYSLNVTVVPQGPLNFLTVYPSSTTRPGVSTLNSFDGRVKANAAIVPANTSDTNRGISIYADNATHVIVDINGYYVPEASPITTTNNQTPLAYYPLPPCRAVDTRNGTGLLGTGSPILGGAQGVNYTLAGVCSLPASAQAYALNYTAIPRNGMALSYLTTWSTGIPQPVVSTLNAPTGTVTANAAVVPVASTGVNAGKVSVFSTADTDLIIDVAGYYAPPASNGLALYNVTPCRAFDSRNSGSNPLAAKTPASFNIASGGTCSVPATAQSFVLNATVLPGSSLLGGPPLGYITTWGTGSAQPLQSVLNAYDGAVTSNLAVVPTFSGNISAYASDATGLLLDLSAYFAP